MQEVNYSQSWNVRLGNEQEPGAKEGGSKLYIGTKLFSRAAARVFCVSVHSAGLILT